MLNTVSGYRNNYYASRMQYMGGKNQEEKKKKIPLFVKIITLQILLLGGTGVAINLFDRQPTVEEVNEKAEQVQQVLESDPYNLKFNDERPFNIDECKGTWGGFACQPFYDENGNQVTIIPDKGILKIAKPRQSYGVGTEHSSATFISFKDLVKATEALEEKSD